jgi:hypothetical protein
MSIGTVRTVLEIRSMGPLAAISGNRVEIGADKGV